MSIAIEDLLRHQDPDPFRRLLDYWLERRAGRLLPAYTDIDPVDIPWALSRVYIVQALADGDFVYRLAGEEIAQRYGRCLKGARIEDLFVGPAARAIRERWRQVVDGPAAYFSASEHPTKGDVLVGRRLILPLSADGRTADHLIGLVDFENVDPTSDDLVDGASTVEVRWAVLASESA